jgi:hypothetical protein
VKPGDLALYDGQLPAGSIVGTPAGYLARDETGRKISLFKSTTEASRAVFAARERRPEHSTEKRRGGSGS